MTEDNDYEFAEAPEGLHETVVPPGFGVSRAFHALADGGSIRIIRPDLIEIRDIEALGAEAGEEDLVSQSDIEGVLQDLQRRPD